MISWARPLGPRRARGVNPRARGTDLRSRLASPRCQSWPTNPRFQEAAYVAARTPLRPVEPPARPIPHRRSRQLDGVPYGSVSDSEWRRRAVATSGPCQSCGDAGYVDDDGAGARVCVERVTPGLDYVDVEPEPP